MIGRSGPHSLFTSEATVTALPPPPGFVLPRAYNNVEFPSFASEKRPSYSQTGRFGLRSTQPGWSLDRPGTWFTSQSDDDANKPMVVLRFCDVRPVTPHTF